MINTIFENVQCDVIATDGDAMRIKTLSKMCKPIKDSQVKGILEKLPLFDLNIILGEKALHFDDKHCAKVYEHEKELEATMKALHVASEKDCAKISKPPRYHPPLQFIPANTISLAPPHIRSWEIF